jgi:hypothetical protein
VWSEPISLSRQDKSRRVKKGMLQAMGGAEQRHACLREKKDANIVGARKYTAWERSETLELQKKLVWRLNEYFENFSFTFSETKSYLRIVSKIHYASVPFIMVLIHSLIFHKHIMLIQGVAKKINVGIRLNERKIE